MSRVMMMFRPWTSPAGVQMTPGLVDRDAYPEIPEECFWSDRNHSLEVSPLLKAGQSFVFSAAQFDSADTAKGMRELMLMADNERLRALIKAVEWSEYRCPWCGEKRDEHESECPAFSSDGKVR